MQGYALFTSVEIEEISSWLALCERVLITVTNMSELITVAFAHANDITKCNNNTNPNFFF